MIYLGFSALGFLCYEERVHNILKKNATLEILTFDSSKAESVYIFIYKAKPIK